MSADRLALPERVKVRAVGKVKVREIVVSGSLRGGNCEVRSRAITSVTRLFCEAVPSEDSICVGIWSTWWTDWPGISISENPTAAADSGVARLSVVPSRVTRKVWNVRVGKVSVWPLVTCEALVRS